jgi:hypothetical protein
MTIAPPMQNHFLSKLSCSPLADGVRWRLERDLHYIAPDGRVVIVPRGFVTDFASIPPLATIGGAVMLLGWLLSLLNPVFLLIVIAAWFVVMLASQMESCGTYDAAAVVHDYLYTTQTMFRWQADWVLFKAMIAPGAGRTVFWKRAVIYFFVRLGGWVAWHKHWIELTGGKFRGS